MALAVTVTKGLSHGSMPTRDQLFRLRLAHPEIADQRFQWLKLLSSARGAGLKSVPTV